MLPCCWDVPVFVVVGCLEEEARELAGRPLVTVGGRLLGLAGGLLLGEEHGVDVG